MRPSLSFYRHCERGTTEQSFDNKGPNFLDCFTTFVVTTFEKPFQLKCFLVGFILLHIGTGRGKIIGDHNIICW
jgi:hypothetical protein